ncbi:MAG: tetratricopeptide repeat protein [Candidatus Coatesbacteria bacterium]|nr:tetratricopeptide repeat protein [Candidatus Coatesbacteria bacterium]
MRGNRHGIMRRYSPNRIGVFVVLIFVWSITSGLSWKDEPSQLAEQAAKLYKENKLDEALVSITSAQLDMPDSLELQYNMSNILYKKGSFEDARAGFRVASQDSPPELAGRANYNLGNASLKAGQIDEAIEAYKNALLIDPNDEEARYNLEIALHTKEQSQCQNQQSEQDQQDQNKDQQDGEQQNSEKNDQQDQQQNKEQEQNEEQKQQQGQQDRQEQSADQAEKGDEQKEMQKPQELTKDQIEQILAALKQQEEKVEKNLHQAKANSASVEKDW